MKRPNFPDRLNLDDIKRRLAEDNKPSAAAFNFAKHLMRIAEEPFYADRLHWVKTLMTEEELAHFVRAYKSVDESTRRVMEWCKLQQEIHDSSFKTD